MPSSSLSDRLLAGLKNNHFVAVVVVLATIIGAVVQFTTVFDTFLDLIGLDGHARVIYRPLAADLGTLERDMNILGHSAPDWISVQMEAHSVEIAAEPACNTKKSVSELGDVSTRQELDAICKAVEIIKNFSDPQRMKGPEGAIALAVVFAPYVKETREELSSRADRRFWWKHKFFNRPVFGNLPHPQ